MTTKMIKNKAYFSDSNKKLFFFDGDNIFDRYGEIVKTIPSDLKRCPKDDKVAKYAVLLGQDKLVRKNETFVTPKTKTIVRIYTSHGDIFYGIVKDEKLIFQNGDVTGLLHTAYEKIRPTKEQRDVLEAVLKVIKSK